MNRETGPRQHGFGRGQLSKDTKIRIPSNTMPEPKYTQEEKLGRDDFPESWTDEDFEELVTFLNTYTDVRLHREVSSDGYDFVLYKKE